MTHSCYALYPWLSQKMTFSKLSKEQDWTQHRVLRNFLDGFKWINRLVYDENTIDTLKHSWQAAETTIYYTSILAGLKFKKGSCLKLSVSFLSYLNLCFALTENKVAVTEEWMCKRAHFTGVRKRKHILNNPNILCTIQFRRSRKTWTSLRMAFFITW